MKSTHAPFNPFPAVGKEALVSVIVVLDIPVGFPVYAVELGDMVKTKYGNIIVEDIDDTSYATVTVITGVSELDIECKVIYNNEDNVTLVFMMEEEVE